MAESWMEIGNTEEGCRPSVKLCFRHAVTWWRETTDPVVLNSPWLRRGTGRFIRISGIVLLVTAGLFKLVYQDKGYLLPRTAPTFCFMSVCLSLSLLSSIRSNRESLAGSIFFASGVTAGFRLVCETHEALFPPELAFAPVCSILCHCNVHPAVLFLISTYYCYEILSLIVSLSDVSTDLIHYVPYILHVVTFQGAMLLAFTWDFTQRVKAVSAGVLGEGLESPVAGRSARFACWFSGLNQWCLWAADRLGNEMLFKRYGDAPFLESQIPPTWLTAVMLAVALVLILAICSHRCRWGSSRLGAYLTVAAWCADSALAVVCCAPALLTMVNFRLACQLSETRFVLFCDFFNETNRRSVNLLVAGVQTLIQAGCHPLVTALATGSLTFGVALWPVPLVYYINLREDSRTLRELRMYPVMAMCALCWMMVLSHWIDFFVRMRGIRQGMQQSRQNAESVSRFLMSSTSGLELQMVSPEAGQSGCSLGPTRPRGVMVAVVRHAERADDEKAFDAWGCSKDAEDFPHDPPITARGKEQTEQLAETLKTEEATFNVIVSSPFLRCLQTALILAEKFDASVLIDQELGEVMGPPIFEHEVPLPPRDWPSLKTTLEAENFFPASSAESRLRAGRMMGKRPQWVETIQQARVRYVKRYLDYLRRARHTKKSFLLVTHGHMVQSCATVLPANQHRKVISVDYCGAVLAECLKLGQPAGATEDGGHNANGGSANEELVPGSSFSVDFGRQRTESDAQKDLVSNNQLLRDCKMKYWFVNLYGLRTVPVNPSAESSALSIQHSIGQSWQDLVQLLGVLPPVIPSAAAVTRSSSSGISFKTQSNTTVSMRMLREPHQVPTSPTLSNREPTRTAPAPLEPAPPTLTSPLSSPTSRLAERRGLSKQRPSVVQEDGP